MKSKNRTQSITSTKNHRNVRTKTDHNQLAWKMLKRLSPEQQYELDRKILDRLLSKQLIMSQEEKTEK